MKNMTGNLSDEELNQVTGGISRPQNRFESQGTPVPKYRLQRQNEAAGVPVCPLCKIAMVNDAQVGLPHWVCKSCGYKASSL